MQAAPLLPDGGTQPKQKKPLLGVVFSAAVPGTGELYAGKWLKGALFLAAEIGLWVGYSRFYANGQELEDEFQAYADTYWSEARWLENYDPSHGATHSLPETKTQQYYEMIGKYDQFRTGWDDYVAGGDPLTPHRDAYESMRHESNVEFKYASYCAMIVLANHMISAFDAGLTIRRDNQRIETAMRMTLKNTRGGPVPCLCLRVCW